MTEQTIAPGPARVTLTVETPEAEAQTFQYDRCVGVVVNDGDGRVYVSFQPERWEAPDTQPIPRVADRTEKMPPVPAQSVAPWADVIEALEQPGGRRRGRRRPARHVRPQR